MSVFEIVPFVDWSDRSRHLTKEDLSCAVIFSGVG